MAALLGGGVGWGAGGGGYGQTCKCQLWFKGALLRREEGEDQPSLSLLQQSSPVLSCESVPFQNTGLTSPSSDFHSSCRYWGSLQTGLLPAPNPTLHVAEEKARIMHWRLKKKNVNLLSQTEGRAGKGCYLGMASWLSLTTQAPLRGRCHSRGSFVHSFIPLSLHLGVYLLIH